MFEAQENVSEVGEFVFKILRLCPISARIDIRRRPERKSVNSFKAVLQKRRLEGRRPPGAGCSDLGWSDGELKRRF